MMSITLLQCYKQKKMNNRKNKIDEEEKPLVEENIKQHTLSDPTVGNKHEWRQEGPFIVCRSCESNHGFRIGVNKKLKGINEEGKPIIE